MEPCPLRLVEKRPIGGFREDSAGAGEGWQSFSGIEKNNKNRDTPKMDVYGFWRNLAGDEIRLAAEEGWA